MVAEELIEYINLDEIDCSDSEESMVNPDITSISMLIHSFIPDIFIGPLQVQYYSEALLTTAFRLCQS